jgi:hypothetical protein
MNQYLIFSLILIFLIALYQSSPLKIPVTSREEASAMHEILLIMDKFFKRYNINYFIMAGTLLGGVRNKPPGILYWDDDIDVGIFDSDLSKLKRLLKDTEFLKLVEVNNIGFGYQLYPKAHRKSNTNKKEFIYDIFIFEKNNKRGGYSIINNWFDFEHIPSKDYIFPIKYKTFWDMRLPFPNKSLEWLKIVFGNNVMDVAKYTNHYSNNGTGYINKDNTTPLHIKINQT